MIPGAIHVPRGMTEFWFDPESPYHKKSLADENKTYILYCAAAWRSALTCKTLNDMGFTNTVHFSEGFNGYFKGNQWQLWKGVILQPFMLETCILQF